jgi:hypothetical protein
MNARLHPVPVRCGPLAVASPKRGCIQSLFTRKEIA